MTEHLELYRQICASIDDLEAPERDELLEWFIAQVNPDSYLTLRLAIARIVRDRQPVSDLALRQV